MAKPIKTLKEAIVSKISNNGSDVSIDDNLDLQSSNEIKNATAVSTDELNSTIMQGDSESVQSAINRASSGDKIRLQQGTYSESVSISTSDLTVVGAGRGTLISGGTSTAIEVSGDGACIEKLAVETASGGGNSARGIDVAGTSEVMLRHVWVEESDQPGINVTADASENIVTNIWCDSANIDGAGVRFAGDNNIADDIIGSVKDLGTGNSVGETA